MTTPPESNHHVRFDDKPIQNPHASPAFLAMRAQLLVLRKQAQDRGEKMFLGVPDSWYEGLGNGLAVKRCPNHHLSTCVLKSEAYGGECCLACMEFVMITFPTDEEGKPLPSVLPKHTLVPPQALWVVAHPEKGERWSLAFDVRAEESGGRIPLGPWPDHAERSDQTRYLREDVHAARARHDVSARASRIAAEVRKRQTACKTAGDEGAFHMLGALAEDLEEGRL